MASKGNNFAKSEGGAMLTPRTNAQPSFGSNIQRNTNANLRPTTNLNNQESDAAQNEPQNTGNPSELDQNKEGIADNQSDKNSSESAADQAQKKVLKEGGKAALQAAGVPNPAAEKIVDTAEKTGALDQINAKVNEIKKKKIVKILPVLSGLIPVIMTFFILILIISMVMYFVAGFENTINAVSNFFTSTWDSIVDLFDTNHKSEPVFLLSLPKEISEDNDYTASYVASIMAPIYYEAIDLNGSGDDEKREEAFYRGLTRVAEIAYYSLNSTNGKLSVEEIAKKIEKLNAMLPIDYQKDDDDNQIIVYGKGGNFERVRTANNDAQNKVKAFSKALSDDLIALSKSGYTFDNEGAYKPYLDSYAQKYIIDTGMSMKNKDLIKDGILAYRDDYKSNLLPQNQTGSSANEDVITLFGSIYGDESCAILTQYEPNSHEFTESQGISSKKIHSIYDGEVIYVNKNGLNLYDNWDSKTQKCMCNGSMCDNYDGSQIKIKFEVDEIEYIATYSNLATVEVETGDIVSKGEVVGTEGSTGCTNINKLSFQLTSENGINYNTNDLLYKCSSFANTVNTCNFNNLKINLIDCNDKTLIKQIPFYEYVKEDVFNNYRNGLNETEYLKAGIIVSTNNILKNTNYQIGVNELDIEVCDYTEPIITNTNSTIIDKNINIVRGQVMTYNKKIISTRYSEVCNRTIKDKNANGIYNSMCNNNALKMAQEGSNYKEILNVYYPNYQLNDNYCLNYAADINQYSFKNDKKYLSQSTYTDDEFLKFENELEEKIEMVGLKTRAATVEAARYLSLGLDNKIPYKVGGNYLKKGLNRNWYTDGFDSCGFISWVLYNGGANIENNMNVLQIVKSQNITGNLKITNELYRHYDKIQVGDFAWKEGHIGIIIGKNDGILYIAEANSNDGLIVTEITSYGESSSSYTHIYFADNYYNGTGNITSMW